MRFPFLFAVFVFSLPLNASAQMRESCDADFMDVMKARAGLEATREMEMAQTIINKPDSVLEYSCFVSDIKNFPVLFSNNTTDRFFYDPPLDFRNSDQATVRLNDLYQNVIRSKSGPVPLIEDQRSEGIRDFSFPPNPQDNQQKYPGAAHFARTVAGDQLHPDRTGLSSTMIFDSLGPYIENNFSHDLLGGRFNNTAPPGTCDFMRKVWEAAKCQNFAMSYKNPNDAATPGDADENWFPTFNDMNPYDPRQLPEACDVPDRAQKIDLALDVAYPDPNASGAIQTNVYDGNEVDFFDLETYPPIKTGLTVTVDGDPYGEGFCVDPGKIYYPDTADCR